MGAKVTKYKVNISVVNWGEGGCGTGPRKCWLHSL